MSRIVRVVGLLCCGWLLIGCQPSDNRGDPKVLASNTSNRTLADAQPTRIPLRAVATTGMVADLVRHVGGDRVHVEQLMGAGVDPHLYKASRDDVGKIMQADVVFYSGLMLEGKLTDALIKAARTKPVFAVSELIDESLLLEPEDAAGHFDPHVWMDVSAWSQCVESVAVALKQIDPAGGEAYQARAKAYQERLSELHQYGRTVIGSIPARSRVLITSHDAFNYLGRAYGIEVVGVQGLSTESEAGLQRINELVDLLVARKVKSVFVESSVSPKSLQAVIDGARARGVEVGIGGELFSDAMGENGTYEGTYEGMLDHNFTCIARGLGGEAPSTGFGGKLGRNHR